MSAPPPVRTRVSELLGVDYPILQAPMGYIARAQLASAVSNAGALGIIETSSGQLDQVSDEIRKMRDLTDKPFGVNIAQMLVRGSGGLADRSRRSPSSRGRPGDDDASIVDFVHDQGVHFVTTSAGDPEVFTELLHDAGITVFHVVPHLRGALKAVAAGVDGLVVEGGEGGGFKNSRDVATMVLLPLVCSKVDVPVIGAGGIADGRTMAAAFVLGAEGVQMGTRMLSSEESPVHANYKQAVLDAPETGTVFLNRYAAASAREPSSGDDGGSADRRHGRLPGFRVLATPLSERLEREERVTLGSLDDILDLYFQGNLDAAFAFGGQVAGRIDEIKPVARIIEETVAEFHEAVAGLAATYAPR
jgi:enoyl-[acyl-carrier protein] reductase II